MPDKSDYTEKQKRSRRAGLSKVVADAKNLLGVWDAPDLATYPVIGVDTSLWTGLFNWALFKERGGTFGILKMLDGKVLDPKFVINYKAARDAGVYITTYQWLYPEVWVSPGGQGREYARLLKDFPVDFSPSVDFEQNKVNPNVQDLRSHLDIFEADYTAHRAMIYSGYYFWREQGSPGDDRWAAYAFWEAWYSKNAPWVPAPWKRWTFWQFTDRSNGVYWGSRPDGEKALDMSYFNGSLAEFLAFCGTPLPPPTPEPPLPEPPPVIVPVPVPPASEWEPWFGGKVLYKKMAGPHEKDVHILQIPIENIVDIVCDSRYTLQSTLNWFKAKNVDIAINGLDGFARGIMGGQTKPTLAAYHGQRSGQTGEEETLYISENMELSLARPAKIWSAESFPNCLIRGGVVQKVAYRDPTDIRARTALGVNYEKHTIIIVIADGGDYLVKKGLTFLEVANILLMLGAKLGVMGDGGGSTVLVRKDANGNAAIVGEPSGENPTIVNGKSYMLRSVAQHTGFVIKK